MAQNTEISWTHHTFNAWIGCDKVSPGCKYCYAEADMDTRRGRVRWGQGQPRSRTKTESQVRRWNRWVEQGLCGACGHTREWHREGPCHRVKGRSLTGKLCPCDGFVEKPRVFSASLSDWLDEEVPIEWLQSLLTLIAETPHLTWLLLTKRPENWETRIGDACAFDDPDGETDPPPGACLAADWLNGDPPPNVWLGVTVENQELADLRIPQLIEIPALVKFLSLEPLLGPVDLGRWIGDWDCHQCGERFWSDGIRGPGITSVDWLDTGPSTDAIPVCPRCNYESLDKEDATIGEVEEEPLPFHWAIVGGESGKNARPMHPVWARDLREQCVSSRVAYHFKQWGAWRPKLTGVAGEPEPLCTGGNWMTMDHDGEVFELTTPWNGRELDDSETQEVVMVRLGKRAAGRVLYGRTWDELPVPA